MAQKQGVCPTHDQKHGRPKQHGPPGGQHGAPPVGRRHSGVLGPCGQRPQDLAHGHRSHNQQREPKGGNHLQVQHQHQHHCQRRQHTLLDGRVTRHAAQPAKHFRSQAPQGHRRNTPGHRCPQRLVSTQALLQPRLSPPQPSRQNQGRPQHPNCRAAGQRALHPHMAVHLGRRHPFHHDRVQPQPRKHGGHGEHSQPQLKLPVSLWAKAPADQPRQGVRRSRAEELDNNHQA